MGGFAAVAVPRGGGSPGACRSRERGRRAGGHGPRPRGPPSAAWGAGGPAVSPTARSLCQRTNCASDFAVPKIAAGSGGLTSAGAAAAGPARSGEGRRCPGWGAVNGSGTPPWSCRVTVAPCVTLPRDKALCVTGRPHPPLPVGGGGGGCPCPASPGPPAAGDAVTAPGRVNLPLGTLRGVRCASSHSSSPRVPRSEPEPLSQVPSGETEARGGGLQRQLGEPGRVMAS